MFYKLRNSYHYSLFNYKTNDIFQTIPIESDTNPVYSLHSMICERDLQMYLLSVKSFISKVEGAAIFAHSDGSLTARSIQILKEHLPGIEIISPEKADEHASHVLTPFLQQVRKYGGTFDRLIDSVLWAKGTYHIQIDCDILTIKYPEYIIEWVKSGCKPFVISDYKKEKMDIKESEFEKAHIQTQMEYRQEEISEKTGFDFGDTIGLCSGLYGWTDQIKLSDIETFVRTCNEMGFDMTRWGAEQVTTTWLLNAKHAERLPRKDYINLQTPAFHLVDTASMIHFIGDNRFKNNWYAQKAIKEINRLLDRSQA